MNAEAEIPSSVPLLAGKRVVLGVSGSIAAYKAVSLASMLTQLEAEVDVLFTKAATEFVDPLTFRSVTGRPAYTEADLWGESAHVLHVEVARQADLFIIAPATANTIAKLAHGEADSLISLAALGIDCPLVIAPAMDAGMFEHPAVQANLSRLKEWGVHIAGPAEGRMASGLEGVGRLLEPPELLGHIRLAMGASGPLQDHRFTVTAAGTEEPLDPVRALTNRSTGKQGFALAQAALDRGAQVTLIAGPTFLPTPVGVDRIDVRTAAEMHEAVKRVLDQTDALIMAAAVADFRPAQQAEDKIKKAGGVRTLELESTVDILAEVGKKRQETGRPAVLVGFAAESQDLERNAREKLLEKGVDLIVANDITAADSGFAVDTNRVTIIDSEGSLQSLPLLSKTEVAERVMERIEDMLNDLRLSS
ncbi:MAG: bifunctional phosphopantothenoylcysteine decarboxylase/phosphopantothenate--cysteine ligase CoaBC [Anaerolineales bacterium]